MALSLLFICFLMTSINIWWTVLGSRVRHVKKGNRLVTNAHDRVKMLPIGNNPSVAMGWLAFVRGSLLGLALIFMSGVGLAEETPSPPLRFGITGVIVQDQHRLLEDWRDYLAARIGRPVAFVSRDRYTDTLDMLRHDKLEAAWLSDYPYILARRQVRLVAIPVYQGKPVYRAYLIVPARDKTTRSILDLRGTVFAYADTISHTGYLVPRYELAQAGKKPGSFFRKTFFTWGHHNSVEAVAAGLADGAYVDSYVWDSMQKISPKVTSQTRIVSRSSDYAFPPIVVSRSLPADDFRRFQAAMLGMSTDPAGRKLLEKLNLDGFALGKPESYDPVEKMMHAVGDK